MHWFFIALGAPFLWALVNIFDQYLVERFSTKERGSGGLVLFSSLIGIFVAAIIAIFVTGLFAIPLLDKILLITAGGLTIAWIIFYLYALELEDVSAVAPWFLTIPIFGYIFGYIFLGEVLTLQQILGSIIILFGLLIISINFSDEKKQFNLRPALYMLAACLLAAIAGIVFKYVTVGEDFWVSSFWEYVGLGMFGILIYIFVPQYRQEFKTMNNEGGRTIFILNTSSEIMTIIGNLLTNFALLLAPVMMVYLVGSFQPAIVLIFTVVGTKLFPKLIKEDLTLKTIIPKIIAISIMLIGSAFLFR